MAQVPDSRLTTLNFHKGVDNRSHETHVGNGYARKADNVDIDQDGVVTVRDGYGLLAPLLNAHSLWAHDLYPFALVADGTQLYRMDPNGALTSLVAGLAGSDVYYAVIGNRIHWSNGYSTGIIKLSNQTLPLGLLMLPWGVETPAPSFTAVAVAAGGLDAGRYGVTLTFANGKQEEGGAPEPAWVDVPQGGGIQVVGIPGALNAANVEARLYRTDANSPDFLYAQSTVPGAPSWLLGAQTLGRPLTTLFRDPFPAAKYLLAKAGRIFGAMERDLVWTDALYYGLYTPSENSMRFPDPIVMIAAPESSKFVMYVGTTRKVYMLEGASLETATQTTVSYQGCIPGSMAMIPPQVIEIDSITTPVPFWIGGDGVPYAGTETGVLQLSDLFAYPIYDKAAAGFIQTEGHSRYIVSGRGGRTSGLAAVDTVVARVYDNGGGS